MDVGRMKNDQLVEWKRREDGRSALLIDGARRVGKSWVAEVFAKSEYKSYALIDFSKVPAACLSRLCFALERRAEEGRHSLFAALHDAACCGMIV